MITPTGQTITLETETARAEIGTVAAALLSLRVNGLDLTEPTAAGQTPSFANGIVLAPWPNRVRDATWNHGGRTLHLAVTEPARNNAIHGLLRYTDYRVEEHSQSVVQLSALIPPQTGWPFFLDTWVRYELESDGLAVTHGMINLASEPAPWAVGAHPFLRVGDSPVEELRLTVHAANYIEVDERMNPVAVASVAGTERDLRGGRLVGSLQLDTAFEALQPVVGADGRGVIAVLEADDGNRTELWQDARWGHTQVFTPKDFVDSTGKARQAVAVEPMSAAPDALNSGAGLVWIAAGGSWQGSWGLRHRGR